MFHCCAILNSNLLNLTLFSYDFSSRPVKSDIIGVDILIYKVYLLVVWHISVVLDVLNFSEKLKLIRQYFYIFHPRLLVNKNRAHCAWISWFLLRKTHEKYVTQVFWLMLVKPICFRSFSVTYEGYLKIVCSWYKTGVYPLQVIV